MGGLFINFWFHSFKILLFGRHTCRLVQSIVVGSKIWNSWFSWSRLWKIGQRSEVHACEKQWNLFIVSTLETAATVATVERFFMTRYDHFGEISIATTKRLVTVQWCVLMWLPIRGWAVSLKSSNLDWPELGKASYLCFSANNEAMASNVFPTSVSLNCLNLLFQSQKRLWNCHLRCSLLTRRSVGSVFGNFEIESKSVRFRRIQKVLWRMQKFWFLLFTYSHDGQSHKILN